MPPLPDVPKVIRTALVHTYGGDVDVVTRFYTRYTGTAPTVAQLSTFNAVAGGTWFSDLAPMASTFVTVTGAESTDLSSPTAAQSIDTFSFTGSRAGTKLPAAACAVTGYEIGRRYRGGHSRGYWPFGVEVDLQTPQTWTSTFVGEFQAAVSGFFLDLYTTPWTGAGTLSQVNVSFYHSFMVVTNPMTGRARNVPTPRAVPEVDVITSVTGRTRVGSQRRRLG